MAAARDQAARILRPEPDVAEGSRDVSVAAPTSLVRMRSEEPAVRRTAEAPVSPAVDNQPVRRPSPPIRPRRNPASANWS